jgi:uncharacterized membrane protein YeaQ/YmgE (transglycosylase-associated protein family)
MEILLVLLLIIVAFVAGIAILGTVASLLWYLLVGLVIGALGRLVAPGSRNMGILMTSLYGIAGALIGGVIAEAADLGNLLQFVVSVAAAAVLVAITTVRGDATE